MTKDGTWHWMGQKMQEAEQPRWEADYYNMQLYRDLLGTNPDPAHVGAHDSSFAKHLVTYGPGNGAARRECFAGLSQQLRCAWHVLLGGEATGINMQWS